MSVEDTFGDHVALLRRTTTAGSDVLGHPNDVFEVVDEFWCSLFWEENSAAREAAGIPDLAPILAILPTEPPINIADDRLQVIYSEVFDTGTVLRIVSPARQPAAGAEYRQVRLVEQLPS